MKHVLKMTFGVMMVLFGLFSLICGAIAFGVIVTGIGALVLYKSYKPWRKWYDRGAKHARDIKEMRKRNKYDSQTILRVFVVGYGSQTNAGSAIGRAIVGDFIAGDVGALVGAATAKENGTTKFRVEYADGHSTIETVKDNSSRFKTLMGYVRQQEASRE